MFKIRKEQLVQMEEARKKESYQRLCAELRRSSPVATSHLDDNSLLSVIEQAARKASKYGVTSSQSVTTFVKIAVFAGLAFDENPPIREFLQTPELDPDYKVNQLAKLASEKLQEVL